MIQHQIIDRLKDCESPDSVISVLREQAQAFHNFRGEDGKLMVWLKRTVDVLHTLSTSDVFSEGIGLVCVDSIHWTTPPEYLFSLAIPTSKSNRRWNRYTSRSMCPNWLYSSESF